MAWRNAYCPSCRKSTNHYVLDGYKKCMKCGKTDKRYGDKIKH